MLFTYTITRTVIRVINSSYGLDITSFIFYIANKNVKNCDNDTSSNNCLTINDSYVTLSQFCGHGNVDGKGVETIMKDKKHIDHEFASGKKTIGKAQILAAVDLGLENTSNNVITGFTYHFDVSAADHDGHHFSMILRDYSTRKNTHAESKSNIDLWNNTKILELNIATITKTNITFPDCILINELLKFVRIQLLYRQQ